VRKLLLLFALVFSLTIASSLQAQEFDGAFGFGTVKAPAATVNSQGFPVPSLSGGLYPSFSGIFRFKHHIGFGGEVSWRAKQAIYGGTTTGFGSFAQPYRPIFYDFNAVYGTTFQKKAGFDVMAGVGGEDLRFYTPYYTCGFTCTNYQSSNHFAGHIGADVRIYFWGHAFVRPEAHYYAVHNNFQFNDAKPWRFGASIGYSFMPGF